MNLAGTALDKPIVSPLLVGRIQEMETLEHALQAAQAGIGQCVLIAGEAGIGKSRLLSEIRRRASAEHFLILQGCCFEPDLAFPYAPLTDALREHLAHRPPLEIQATLGPFAPEILKLLPEMALVLPDLKLTPPLDPEAEKRRLFESLTHFFIHLAARQPLLIILEDLHWSDDTSLDFLQQIARHLSTQPILLLASYRHEEAPRRLSHLLAQFDRQHLAHEIVLSPLARNDMDMMLRAIFGLPYSVKTEFLDLLYPLTEGNPFFLEEVLKALIAAQEIYYTEGRWERKPIVELHTPRSVQDAVTRRSDRLSEAARKVLTLASVVGRRFDFALLQQLSGIDTSELFGLLKELVAAQLIVEESAERFSFRHALTHKAIYAWLLQRERQDLHRQVAETLERIHAGVLDAHVSELARHYSTAGVWTKALTYSQQAGLKAQAMYAPREAIDHLTHSVEAARQMSLPPPIEILRARGKAYETVGEFEEARVDYEEALTIARQAQDRRAEWQQLIDLGFLWTSRDYSRTGEYFQRALELAHTLGDPAMVGHSLNRLGNWHENVQQAGEGLRYHQRALEVFESLNDPRGLAETLDLLGMTSQLNSALIQSHTYYQRAISIARDSDNRWDLASGLACLTLCAPSYLKNLDVPATSLVEATQAAEEAIRIAREIDWRAGEAFVGLLLAMCLGPQGEYARALDAARASLALAEEIQHQQWIIGAQMALGILQLDLLAFNAARSHLEKALALAREVGSDVWTGAAAGYLVTTYTAQGEFGRADALLNEVLTNDTAMQTQNQRLGWYARGELALAQGDAETALGIANKLTASAQNLTTETVIPRVWKLRGEALAGLGKLPEAEAVLQAAQTAAFEQGAHPLLWRLRVTQGKLYQAGARRGDAQAEFSAAQEEIQRLAVNVPDEGLRHEFVARAIAAMPPVAAPSPAQIEKKKFGGLTAREREVAALIGRGKPNREIASELVVGLRTVEAHITRILNKLGFSSRTQIAVWAVEQGLVQAPRDKNR